MVVLDPQALLNGALAPLMEVQAPPKDPLVPLTEALDLSTEQTHKK